MKPLSHIGRNVFWVEYPLYLTVLLICMSVPAILALAVMCASRGRLSLIKKRHVASLLNSIVACALPSWWLGVNANFVLIPILFVFFSFVSHVASRLKYFKRYTMATIVGLPILSVILASLPMFIYASPIEGRVVDSRLVAAPVSPRSSDKVDYSQRFLQVTGFRPDSTIEEYYYWQFKPHTFTGSFGTGFVQYRVKPEFLDKHVNYWKNIDLHPRKWDIRFTESKQPSWWPSSEPELIVEKRKNRAGEGPFFVWVDRDTCTFWIKWRWGH